MKKLSEDLELFFYSSLNGFDLFLSEFRQRNKPLIELVYNCLLLDNHFTGADIEHLRNFRLLTDLIEIPEFRDCKSLIEVEYYLRQSVFTLTEKELRYTLEYLFFLFCRHEKIQADLKTSREELNIWRQIKCFKNLEQNILVNYVSWLEAKRFSKISICNSLTELTKLYKWLESFNLAFEQVNNRIIQEYLSERALKDKLSTKQRILCDLKPFFAFYKSELQPSFLLPTLTIQVKKSKGLFKTLSGEDIEKLHKAIQSETEDTEGALMLYLLIKYNVPLKCLRLVEVQEDKLVYFYRCPSRMGEEEKQIDLLNDKLLSWLISFQKRDLGSVYLFQSKVSRRRKKPLCVDYCQQEIQRYVYKVLGQKISARQIHRDCLKHRAKHKKLTAFIDETTLCPFRNRTKLFYWLNGK